MDNREKDLDKAWKDLIDAWRETSVCRALEKFVLTLASWPNKGK